MKISKSIFNFLFIFGLTFSSVALSQETFQCPNNPDKLVSKNDCATQFPDLILLPNTN